jgi:hypothetical protein
VQVYDNESRELSDTLLGFVGDGKSANKAAMAYLEGKYPYLINIWCRAPCMSCSSRCALFPQYIAVFAYSLFKTVSELLYCFTGWCRICSRRGPHFSRLHEARHIVKELHAHADTRQKLRM